MSAATPRRALRDERRPRQSRHAQTHSAGVQREHYVQHDVYDGGEYEQDEGRTTVAHGVERRRGRVVQQHEYDAESVYLKVGVAVGEDGRVRIEQSEYAAAEHLAHHREHHAYRKHGNDGRGYGGFHVGVPPPPHEVGYHDRRAVGAALRYGNVYERDGIGHRRGRKRVHAQHPARDYAVREVVELLEHGRDDHGDAEEYERLYGAARSQVFYHFVIPERAPASSGYARRV